MPIVLTSKANVGVNMINYLLKQIARAPVNSEVLTLLKSIKPCVHTVLTNSLSVHVQDLVYLGCGLSHITDHQRLALAELSMLTATAIVRLNEPHKKNHFKGKKRKTILQTKSKKKQTMSIKKWNKDHRQTLCLIPTSN